MDAESQHTSLPPFNPAKFGAHESSAQNTRLSTRPSEVFSFEEQPDRKSKAIQPAFVAVMKNKDVYNWPTSLFLVGQALWGLSVGFSGHRQAIEIDGAHRKLALVGASASLCALLLILVRLLLSSINKKIEEAINPEEKSLEKVAYLHTTSISIVHSLAQALADIGLFSLSVFALLPQPIAEEAYVCTEFSGQERFTLALFACSPLFVLTYNLFQALKIQDSLGESGLLSTMQPHYLYNNRPYWMSQQVINPWIIFPLILTAAILTTPGADVSTFFLVLTPAITVSMIALSFFLYVKYLTQEATIRDWFAEKDFTKLLLAFFAQLFNAIWPFILGSVLADRLGEGLCESTAFFVAMGLYSVLPLVAVFIGFMFFR